MPNERELIRRQRVFAQFGDFVLDHDDLEDILNEGCRLIAEALDAPLAKVIEIDRDANTGLVRAGVGWRPGIVGHERISLSERSSEAFAIKSAAPVITNDIAKEERFEFPAFLRAHGVIALVNVPIFLPGRKPYGVLQVDARETREFDQQDIEFLKTYAMVLGPVIDRLKATAELRNTDQRLRLILENARAYVMVVSDADDRITDWLGGSEDILGWPASSAIGNAAEMIFTDEDRNAGVPEKERAKARENGTTADVRWHRRQDGTRVFLDGQTIALKDQGGKPQGYFRIAQDFTDRKRNEEQQSFLLKLSDALRPLTMVSDIATLAVARLGEHLGVNRVVYGEMAGGTLKIQRDYTSGVSSIVGEHALESIGSEFLSAYASGAIVQVEDIEADPRLCEAARIGFRDRQIAAFADLVLFDEERRVSVLGLQSATPRAWLGPEKNLLRAVGERVKSAIERARAEVALRESEARLRQFGEASSDILWMRNAETLQWNYLSPAFEAIYGIPVNQALVGDNLQKWTNLLVEEDRDLALDSIKRVRDGEHISFECRIRRPDGEIRWLRDTDFPIRGPGGRVEHIGGIGQDITETKQAQQRLEHSEERLRNAVEVGRLGLWDWNVPTNEVHWSDEQFRMAGYEVGEVSPSYEAWASRIHPDDRSGAVAALREAMDAHTEFAREFRRLHSDGSVRWLYGRGRFSYSEDGHPLRMIGAMVDTTERREWEERQKVLVAELQHRTRNLMAVVRSMAAKTARSSTDLSDFRARFHDRLDALARVQGLLSQLNDVDRVTFDELIRTELSAINGDSDKVTLEGPAGVRLRSSTVQTLAMALHELATNAVKYGALRQPEAQLAVTWWLEPAAASGTPSLRIDWRESGVVIPPDGSAPRGSGQGRELIEQALPYQLSATTSYMLGPEGVHCTISIPISGTTLDAHHG